MKNSTAPKLVAKGIAKRFGNFTALHDVDAVVFPGRITAFVGPNGAGKTTLFHIFSGNLRPDKGSVLLDGRNITGMPPWKTARLGIGKLFQDVRVFENMTVLENICVALLHSYEQTLFSVLNFSRKKMPMEKYHEEAMHWLDFVGLAELADHKGGELSFGQQKLLSIARLIAHKSTCLLLDEPTAALSPVMIKKMIDLIQKLVSEQNLSVALIEHNMPVVKELAFYTYFMHEGTVFCHGTQNCVLENPEVRELYMGLSGTAEAMEVK